MPSNTATLNLYKYKPATDGNLTFNIKNALNDNFDKIDSHAAGVNTHISNTNNPHSVTKNQIGLGNVDNTSDIDCFPLHFLIHVAIYYLKVAQ